MRQPDSISDEDLILHYYGEGEHVRGIDEALESSTELEQRYAELRLVLDAVGPTSLPARSDLYGHEVWKRVYPHLERRRRPRLPKVAGWAVAASLLIVASFWAGRETAPRIEGPTAFSQQARNRVLLVAVADHLERSQFLLLELTNSEASGLDESRIDDARELKVESRLYRQAAQKGGEADVAFLLEELERFLTELAQTGPGAESDLAALLGRIEDKNLLFKVRVLGSQLEERTRPEESGATI